MTDFFGANSGSIPPEVKEIIKTSSEDEVVEIMLQSLKMAMENPDELKKAMPGIPGPALASLKFFPKTDAALRPMAKVMAQLLIKQVKTGVQPSQAEVTKAVSEAMMGGLGSGAFGGMSGEDLQKMAGSGLGSGLGSDLNSIIPGSIPSGGLVVPATNQQSSGSLPPDIAQKYQKLMASGKNRIAEQSFVEAEDLFKKSVELAEEHQEESHELFSALQHLSIVQLEQESYEEAEPVLKRWLNMGENLYSPEHHLLAGAYLGLGRVRESQKKMSDAELLYNRALAIAEATADEDRESYVSTIESVAFFYDSRKRYKKADELFNRVYSLKKDAYGEKSMEVAEYETQYASVLNDRGSHQDAKQWCLRAYETQMELTDETDPDVFETRLTLISAYAGLGEREQALKELEALEQILRENGDEDMLEELEELEEQLKETAGSSESN